MRLITSIIFLSLAAAALTLLWAQTPKPPITYLVVNYYSVQRGSESAYIQSMESDGKKFLAEMMNQTPNLLEWGLSTAAFTGVKPDGRLYVLTTAYLGPPPQLDADRRDAITKKALGISWLAYQSKSLALRKPVGNELYRVIAMAPPSAPPEYSLLVRFKSEWAQQAANEDLIRNWIQPMAAADIKEGTGRVSWGAAWLASPTGESMPYTYATAHGYKDLATVIQGVREGEDLFRKVHPEKSYSGYLTWSRDVRRIVETQIVRRVMGGRRTQ